MAVDQKLVSRKINLILEDVKELKSVAEVNLEQYLSDPKHELVTERLLERIIGRMIDINFHLLTSKGFSPPKNYFESFSRLHKDMKMIDKKFAEELAMLSGLRNRLAHEYNGLDEEKVYYSAKKLVKEIKKYLSAVEEFIR